jgi:dTDP-4-dehydrorhamnose reductase
MKVAVLGASGMLGAMVADVLTREKDVDVVATFRDDRLARRGSQLVPAQWRVLDAAACGAEDLADVLRGCEWAVNAIGVIKPYIHDDNAAEVERALLVNALFPHRLARAAEAVGCRVLQIATDCVYSGTRGQYTERDPHDALDVYGKTKSLGEVFFANVAHLRCSIIGPEPKGHVSLLDWFRKQPPGITLKGFTNHLWNGVTTLHFAKLCVGIIRHGLVLPHSLHIVPEGEVSKYDLLRCFASSFARGDLQISPCEASTVVNRTLRSTNDQLNREVWRAAGFAAPLAIPAMIADLAADSGCLRVSEEIWK